MPRDRTHLLISCDERMRKALGFIVATTVVWSALVSAADREWQRGVWVEVNIKRPRFVIGVQPRNPTTQMPEMTVIRTYVIHAEGLRLELKEPAPAPLRTVDAMIGESVTFALEKNTVYIRGEDGIEFRLLVTKRGDPPKEKPER